MNVLARVAVVGLLTLLLGCTAQKPAEPAPPSTPAQSDVPPPLVPAMALPENAVENAVAKLDGLAEDLMKKSGIPGWRCPSYTVEKPYTRRVSASRM